MIIDLKLGGYGKEFFTDILNKPNNKVAESGTKGNKRDNSGRRTSK